MVAKAAGVAAQERRGGGRGRRRVHRSCVPREARVDGRKVVTRRVRALRFARNKVVRAQFYPSGFFALTYFSQIEKNK